MSQNKNVSSRSSMKRSFCSNINHLLQVEEKNSNLFAFGCFSYFSKNILKGRRSGKIKNQEEETGKNKAISDFISNYGIQPDIKKGPFNNYISNSMSQNSNKVTKPRRLFLNLKVQTQKDDSKKALRDQGATDSTKSSGKNRSKNQPQTAVGDLYETLIEDNFDDLFEKGKKLGEGAHAVVYEFIEKKSRKTYAVKVFKNCDCERIREIRESYLIMRQLDHPFIAKAENLYINEGHSKCYLVMEACNYKNLRLYIDEQQEKGQKILEERAAFIMNNIFVGLKYLKQKGVCHRDVKPENILYDPETGNIKLIDFELCKMKKYKDEILEMWTYTGSLFYRAPESFTLGYGETIDMWAAGVVAFELLTGKLPFFSSSIKGVTEQILTKQLDLDKQGLSVNAKKFLRQILEKDPKKRLTPCDALKSCFLLKNSPVKRPNFPKLQIKNFSEKTTVKTEGEQVPSALRNQKALEENDKWMFTRPGQRHNEIYLIK